jgi:hypothetical protein
MKALRGLLGIGLIWGVLWAVVAPRIGVAGFLCGVVFAALVVTAPNEGSPLVRVVTWGILVAAVLPLVTGRGISEMLVTVPLGALSAATSIAIALRHDPFR